jgi:type II secretory pathway pseudopilin PulG
MSLHSRSIHATRGLTLVELLMVITVMVLLMAVAVPLIRPAFQDRYLREAARQLDAFFSAAQARAAESGRPVGVWIQRRDDSLNGGRVHSVQLYMAEVPPSFSGGMSNARVTVTLTGLINFNDVDKSILSTLIGDGDAFTIRFDHKGPTFIGTRSGTTFSIASQPRGCGVDPGLPFEVTAPPSRSMVAPLTLPADSVVDLYWSGIGTSGNDFAVAAGTRPVIVTFAPSGAVDYVYCYVAGGPITFSAYRPLGPLHFLIGRRNKVIDPTDLNLAQRIVDPQRCNLADPTCLWVKVNNQTGAIVTTDNGDIAHLPAAASVVDRIRAAREFARESIQKGGR